MSHIFVCPLSDLDATLETSGARWMVSLMGPGKSSVRPSGITRGFLGLEFHDIDGPRDNLLPPSRADVTQLLEFFDGWDGHDPLLIHCWMGISRSTAAAAIALAQRLRLASPMATPNRLMIALADEQLGLNGNLCSAIAAIGRGADASQGEPFCLEVAA